MPLPRVLKQADVPQAATRPAFGASAPMPSGVSESSSDFLRSVVRGVIAPPDDAPPAGTVRQPRVLRGHDVASAVRPVRIAAPRPSLSAPSSPTLPREPEPTPEERRAAAEAEAAALHAEAIEAARAEGYAAGQAAGRAEAEAELQVELDALRASVGPDLAQLAEAWRSHHERVERQLVGVALEAADLLSAVPLSDAAREATDRAVLQAIEELERGDGLHVRLHPVAFLRLQENGVVDTLGSTHPGIRWTPDDACAEGDWSVESAEAVIRRVRTELLDGLRARLDLLQAAQDAPSSPRTVLPTTAEASTAPVDTTPASTTPDAIPTA